MKKLLFLILLISGSVSIANAQVDYCKDIKKKFDEMKNNTTFVSPSISRLVDMTIEKDIGDGTGRPIFYIGFKLTKENAAYDYRNVYVKFDDGTIITYVQDIDCSYLNTEDHYLFLGGKVLHAADLEILKTKKIVKFQMADKDIVIPDDFGTKFKAWVNCMVDTK